MEVVRVEAAENEVSQVTRIGVDKMNREVDSKDMSNTCIQSLVGHGEQIELTVYFLASYN